MYTTPYHRRSFKLTSIIAALMLLGASFLAACGSASTASVVATPTSAAASTTTTTTTTTTTAQPTNTPAHPQPTNTPKPHATATATVTPTPTTTATQSPLPFTIVSIATSGSLANPIKVPSCASVPVNVTITFHFVGDATPGLSIYYKAYVSNADTFWNYAANTPVIQPGQTSLTIHISMSLTNATSGTYKVQIAAFGPNNTQAAPVSTFSFTCTIGNA